MAVAALKKEQIADAFSKVTIINFNYDRLIEQFIYSALRTRLRVDQDEATKAISGLRTIRPYGKVGSLPWQKEGSVLRPGGGPQTSLGVSGDNPLSGTKALVRGVSTPFSEGRNARKSAGLFKADQRACRRR
jgi:hypothetical protein